MQRERSRRGRRRLRARPLIHLVPNIFTVMSLCFGLTGIRYALDARFELAVTLIVLAGIFDGLDGRSARLLKSTSSLGAQLDSLADFLSFGVAPAMLVYLWSLHTVKGIGWALALLFATACALRLARFNTELDTADRPVWMARFFSGMPAPAAAGIVMLPMMLAFGLGDSWPRTWALNAAVMVSVALLMVSKVPTFSLKMVTLRVSPDWVPPTLVLVGMLVASLLTVPWLTLVAVGTTYLASLPFGVLMARRLRRRSQQAAAGPVEPVAARSAVAAGDDRVVPLAEPKSRQQP
jgi:CDP-diacylglycerol--serine O-phosphatidyltransferase